MFTNIMTLIRSWWTPAFAGVTFFGLLIPTGFSQNLTGSIVNQAGESLSGCGVSLLNAQGTAVSVNGAFSIPGTSISAKNPEQIKPSAGHDLVYHLDAGGQVTIELLNMKGVLFHTLENRWMGPGHHRVQARSIARAASGNGTWLLRIRTAGNYHTYKLTVSGDFIFSVPLGDRFHTAPQAKRGAAADSLIIQCRGYMDYRFPVADYGMDLGELRIQQPNLVFMMADDMGYGDVGFNGNDIIKTPHLDQMAADGIKFTRFYSIGPVCAPTRASFLTGRHYMRFGMITVNIGMLPTQEITLARISKSKGYTTGHFGKWHLGSIKKGISPIRTGIQADAAAPPWERDYDDALVSESNLTTWDPLDYTSDDLRDKHKDSFWYNGEREYDNMEGSTSRILMDRAIPFMQKAVQDKKPFMTTIWFHAPHSPVRAGPEYLAMYPSVPEGAKHYYGCITALDEQVGRLRAELETLGIARNTLVFFTSDNGPEGNGSPPAQFDLYQGANYGVTGGFRARKRSLYNGGVGVPALMAWPGKINPGQTVDMPAGVYDYVPTVADLLNYEYTDQRPIDGISLVPLIYEGMEARSKPMPFASNHESPYAAYIKGDYKFTTDFTGGGVEDAIYHLYDDPGESNNLISLNRQTANAMKDELADWITETRDSFEGKDYPEAYEQQGSFFRNWPLPNFK